MAASAWIRSATSPPIEIMREASQHPQTSRASAWASAQWAWHSRVAQASCRGRRCWIGGLAVHSCCRSEGLRVAAPSCAPVSLVHSCCAPGIAAAPLHCCAAALLHTHARGHDLRPYKRDQIRRPPASSMASVRRRTHRYGPGESRVPASLMMAPGCCAAQSCVPACAIAHRSRVLEVVQSWAVRNLGQD